MNYMGESRNKAVDRRTDDLTEVVDFGKAEAEDRDPQLAAQEKETARSRSGGISRRKGRGTKRFGSRMIALDARAKRFAEDLKKYFSAWIKRSPRAFKKRVLSRVASQLPPYPRPAGRPRSENITKAVNLYRRQKREIRNHQRGKVNWMLIGKECIPNCGTMSLYLRRIRLGNLRNAVHARLKREGDDTAHAHAGHAAPVDLP